MSAAARKRAHGATRAAVVSDLVEIARDLAAGRLSAKNVVGFLESRELEPAGRYLRLTLNDEPGITSAPRPMQEFPSPGDLRLRYEQHMRFSLVDQAVEVSCGIYRQTDSGVCPITSASEVVKYARRPLISNCSRCA